MQAIRPVSGRVPMRIKKVRRLNRHVDDPVFNVEDHVHLRIARHKRGQHWREKAHRKRKRRIYPQPAARYPAIAFQRHRCLINIGKDTLGIGTKQPARIGQAQMAG